MSALPDVPSVQPQGLYTLLQALRKQVSDLTDQVNALTSPGGGGGVTPPQFDNDNSLATTAFVQRALGNRANLTGLAANTVLTAAYAGGYVLISGGAQMTLPLASSVAPGTEIAFGAGAGGGSVKPQGSDLIQLAANTSLVTLGAADTLTVVAAAGPAWYVQGGSAQLVASAALGGSKGSPFWQKLPSGMIVQAGFGQIASGTSVVFNLPIAFSTAAVGSIVSLYAGGITPKIWSLVSLTQLTVITDTAGATNFGWLAFGY